MGGSSNFCLFPMNKVSATLSGKQQQRDLRSCLRKFTAVDMVGTRIDYFNQTNFCNGCIWKTSPFTRRSQDYNRRGQKLCLLEGVHHKDRPRRQTLGSVARWSIWRQHRETWLNDLYIQRITRYHSRWSAEKVRLRQRPTMVMSVATSFFTAPCTSKSCVAIRAPNHEQTCYQQPQQKVAVM